MIEQRRAIMELADALTVKRKELLETIGKLNEGIAALVEHADKLLPSAASEGLGGVRTSRLGYKTHSPSPSDIADAVARKPRTCGACNELGHDRRNCPNLAALKRGLKGKK